MNKSLARLRCREGYSLLELAAVVALIAILTKIVIITAGDAIGKARDAKRMADVGVMTTALQNYRLDNGHFPVEFDGGSYIVSYDANFLVDLIPNYLKYTPKDPINDAPNPFDWFTKNSHYYGYYYYSTPATQGTVYGCGNRMFAVLGVRLLEATKPNVQKAYCGPAPPFVCPPWGIANVCRDWSLEYDYSMMLDDY